MTECNRNGGAANLATPISGKRECDSEASRAATIAAMRTAVKAGLVAWDGPYEAAVDAVVDRLLPIVMGEDGPTNPHTPGPLVAWQDIDGYWVISPDDKRDSWVAFMSAHNSNAEGDAHLYAAAPDLLELAKSIRDGVVRDVGECPALDDDWLPEHCTLAKLDAVIAKAEWHAK